MYEGANDPCQQDIWRLLQLQYSISCPIFCFIVFTSLLRGWRIVPTLNFLARLVIWSYSPGDASSNPLFRSVVKCVDEVCAGCCQMNSLLFVAFILPGNVTAIHIWNKCWRSWVINWIWILISWTTLNREQFELWIHLNFCQARVQSQIKVPNSGPKSKSQIPNPKSRGKRLGLGLTL